MAIHDGVIGESSTRKRSLGEIVWGEFWRRGGTYRGCGIKIIEGVCALRKFCENLCNSWQRTQRIANGQHLYLAYSHRPPPAPMLP